MDQQIFELTLAALLHDIGKVYQRACKSNRDTLCTAARQMDAMVSRNDRSYAHCLWTSNFINENAQVLLKMGVGNIGAFDALASCHHNPSSNDVWQNIITEADRASAGLDRQKYMERKDDSESAGKGMHYYERPLDSVFSRVRIDKNTGGKAACYSMASAEGIFPVQETVSLTERNYADVGKQFADGFKTMDIKTGSRCLASLATLIEDILGLVPSSTMEEFADIPLADHAITTAAISAAMGRSVQESNSMVAPRDTKFLWVTGDFCGIQNFIFSVSGESNRNLARLLRGRSFFINIATVIAARMLTDSCGLPPCNAVSVAGGKFQILLQDTAVARSAVEKVRTGLTDWLHREYFGELKLIIDQGVSFGIDGFEQKNFPEIMRKSAKSLAVEKKRVFASILDKPESWIDDQSYREMHDGVCNICGHEPAEKGKCGKHCRDFIDFGTNLTHSLYVSLYKVKTDAQEKCGPFTIAFGNELDENALAVYRINNHKKAQNVLACAKLRYASATPKVMEKPDDGNELEPDEARNLTFEEIAQKSEGLNALAVLKADVDNLGYIFSAGLGSANTLSRRNTLSRHLDMFFTEHVPVLISRNPEFENVYTLFSGGDDLCLIGPWNAIIALSATLQKDFSACTAHNPDITISAGIELFHSGFPVSRAVAQAEELLDKSKSSGRNRVTLLGRTMTWGNEFDCQRAFVNDWENFVTQHNSGHDNEEHGYTGMLYRFLKYWQTWRDTKKGSTDRLRHRFRIIYDIARNLPPRIGEKNWSLEKPFKELITTHTPGLEETDLFRNLGVGIGMAMYKHRKN